MKKAFITGITGQDGSYLAEFLLEKGYEVHGLVRRTSTLTRGRIEPILHDKKWKGQIFMYYGDMTDGSSLMHILADIQPDEVYNLAAQSHVQISFKEPEHTAETDAIGVLKLLEAIKSLKLEKKCKMYQASTSELYGDTKETVQNENTFFKPVSPYAAAKLYAYYMCECYKRAYGLFICNGLLFNHESPRRSENFVSRKITLSIAEMLSSRRDCLVLGNLDSKRDWGYAGDYVEAMWMILQQDEPDDYVVATGECYSVRDFVEYAFDVIGIKVAWKGTGADEIGYDKKSERVLVRVSPKYYRPVEVPYLRGDPKKVMEKLGWKPKVSFKELVKMMLESDMKLLNARH